MNETNHAVEAVTGQVFSNLTTEFLRYPRHLKANIETVERISSLSLEVIPHKDDARKLIGREGAMFHAMKTLLTVVTRRYDYGFHYSVNDPQEFGNSKMNAFAPSEKWPSDRIDGLLVSTLSNLFDGEPAVEWNHLKDKSNVVIIISESETKHVPDTQLRDSLRCIFNAIGMSNGRRIFVDDLIRR